MLAFLRQKFAFFWSGESFARVLTGSAWALSAAVLAMIFSLLASLFVARIYGAEMVGILAIIQALMQFAIICTLTGTNVAILRLIPQHVAKYSFTSAFKVYRQVQLFVVATSFSLGVLLYFSSDFVAESIFAKPYLSFFVALVAGFLVFGSLAELNTQAVRALQLAKAFAIVRVLPSAMFLLLLIGLSFLFDRQDVPVYAQLASWTVTAFAGAIVANHAFKGRMRMGDRVRPVSILDILRISSPMLVTAFMQLMIGQTGIIVLGMFGSDSDVGHYSVAVKMATLSSMILIAINSMTAPIFSEAHHNGAMEELFQLARKSTRLIFWASVPLILALVAFGEPILSLLFGSDFAVAYSAMTVLLIGQLVNSASGSTGLFMNMTGHQIVFRNVMVVTGLTNVILSALLIPSFGIIGAAIGAASCMVAWNIFTLYYIWRMHGQWIGYLPFTTRNSS